MAGDAEVRAENAARTSYGRLLALLASRTHDLAAAEDALADAFERALTRWPVDGTPDDPDAWLLTVARNRQRDRWKSAAERRSLPFDEAAHDAAAPGESPDRRLELLLVCAHPAVADASVPLMLNTVLGFTAEQIGAALLIPTATMAARLTRAKKRIARERIPFAVPETDALAGRLGPVFEAVYGSYSIEWPTPPRERHALLLGLAGTIAESAPTVAEAHGLAALMYLSSARLPARVDEDGRYIPLPLQDPRRWDRDLIAAGHRHLRVAHALGTVGRFQLEAAIGAVHCARRPGEAPDWANLRRLYDALVALAPTRGAAVARAAVIAETDGARAGLEALDLLDGVERLQPAWAVRASLLDRLGEPAADAAYAKAISITTDSAEREYLARRARGTGR
ncbi:RNA polymerase sigma factor [Tsukamurella sp. USMM236]|uniref:RNA polymerase sigma factor n=1 Tax=Tsukamurella sp. USMM236 TaxID=3081301 RepID=UPI00301A907C